MLMNLVSLLRYLSVDGNHTEGVEGFEDEAAILHRIASFFKNCDLSTQRGIVIVVTVLRLVRVLALGSKLWQLWNAKNRD